MIQPSLRKQLRVGVTSERAAVNAVRSLLEKHHLVVDEVDSRSDYGRDLNVDITRDDRITGGIIGVQVKGGSSFFRRGKWVIPAAPADWHYWRSSTVPVVGIVHEPGTDVLRWINLTRVARSRVLDSARWLKGQPQSDESDVEVDDLLNDATFDKFIESIQAYLDATSDSAFLLLVDPDDETRRRGVFNCWTLGRHNPAPLILLRRLLPSLEGFSLLDAITALAHATAHPDIFWSRQNWISPPVATHVAATFSWSPDELAVIVHKTEALGAVWQRGGGGQSIWMLMAADPDLGSKLPIAIRRAIEDDHDMAAARLLTCYQAIAPTVPDDIEAVIAESPALLGNEYAAAVLEMVRTEGRLSLF